VAASVRNDFRAGIATLATITTIAIVILSLPQWLSERPIEYALSADSEYDLTGLVPGSPVLVGGLNRGRVLSVTNEPLAGGGTGSLVRFEIASDPPIFTGARPRVLRNLISQQSEVNFASVGVPGPTGDRLEPRTALPLNQGDQPPSTLLTPSMQLALEAIEKHLDAAVRAWGDTGADARQRFTSAYNDVLALRDDFQLTWPALRARVTALSERYRALQADFERLADEYRAAKVEFDAVVAIGEEGGAWPRTKAAFSRLAESWSAMVSEASPLGDAFSRIRERGSRVGDGQARFRNSFRMTIDELDAAELVADLILAAGQFGKLYDEAYSEVWRVLIPNESRVERQREALDDLSHAMLRGAGDAEAAQRALESLLETGAFADDAATEAVKRIEQARTEFNALEQALWRKRTQNAPR